MPAAKGSARTPLGPIMLLIVAAHTLHSDRFSKLYLVRVLCENASGLKEPLYIDVSYYR